MSVFLKYLIKKVDGMKRIGIILATIIFIVSTLMFARELWRGYSEESAFEGIRGLFEASDKVLDIIVLEPPSEAEGNLDESEEQSTQVLDKFYELTQINEDIKGWVRIKDTNISYPVMQTMNDEEYYLHRNYQKEYSLSGTPFLDADADITQDSNQLVIYGHNMKNGTMFKDILKYRKENFWKTNSIISFDTLFEKGNYKIFAAIEMDCEKGNGHFPFYQYNKFDNEEEFGGFLTEIKSLSIYDTGILPEYGDELLTLVTCSKYNGNDRMIVMAVKE